MAETQYYSDGGRRPNRGPAHCGKSGCHEEKYQVGERELRISGATISQKAR